jgi:TRAP transporter TAXI family solute receptor
MVVVPIPAEVVARINDPAYIAGVIPANTYEGQAGVVTTIAIENFLVTHEGVSTDTVYKMTKSMYENLDQMVAAHAAAKAIKREDGPKHMPVPLHPGAEKYYREVGLIK